LIFGAESAFFRKFPYGNIAVEPCSGPGGLPFNMIIYCTVTNDLNFDQRMQRICGSLSAAGHSVVLVGRLLPDSIALPQAAYRQKRLGCFFRKGAAFYLEYNLRLFFFLLFRKMDLVCAIDLDTILPCWAVSALRGKKRVYDAHELFCEMKEVVTRPRIHRIWKSVERFAVPRFPAGYTVNQPIADEFRRMYGVQYAVIRNVPLLLPQTENAAPEERFILYQGAVNEGRCFETLIPAMQQVACTLVICGVGNYLDQAQALVAQYGLQTKVRFMGNLPPHELRLLTARATIGINLVENNGLSNYLSLANKFFDYIHAGIPQLCSGFPAYRAVNDAYEVGLLITDMSADNIAASLNKLLSDGLLYERLRKNCAVARNRFNWQEEEKSLMAFYQFILE
jgi:glycosyltransferase involved in cell wall biosynthesis